MYTNYRFGTPSNDVLWSTSANDAFYGLGDNDWFFASDFGGGSGEDHYDGGEGIDTVDYRHSLSGVTVDLSANSGTQGDADGDTYESIENVSGTEYDDTITGDGLRNELYGLAGRDELFGGGGADALYGGWDRDMLYGGRGRDELYGGTGNDLLDGGAGVDELYGGSGRDFLYGRRNGDDLIGGSGNDELYGGGGGDTLQAGAGHDILDGGSGSDELYGGLGDDWIYGSDGNDVINGGTGIDTLDYSNLTSGPVTVDLQARRVDKGGSGGQYDLVSDVARVYGTTRDDIFYGDATDNTFIGLVGSDRFYGDAGDDTYYGGSGGTDTVIYDGTSGSLRVELSLFRGTQVHAASGESFTDNLYYITNVEVSGGAAHYLSGDSQSNWFTLLDGVSNSDLYGRHGSDYFFVSGGTYQDNTIDGGAGVDSLWLNDASGNWTVDLASGYFGQIGFEGNTLSLIEKVVGSAQGDTIRGDARDNELSGSGGDDYLDGREGSDTLHGGTGSDVFRFTHTDLASEERGYIRESDTVIYFTAGEDVINLRGSDIISWDDLRDDGDGDFIEQDGDHVVIHTSDVDTVTLRYVQLSELSQDDFVFFA